MEIEGIFVGLDVHSRSIPTCGLGDGQAPPPDHFVGVWLIMERMPKRSRVTPQ